MTTNTEIARYTLDKLTASGADAAQCIISQGKTDELNADGGKFSLMRSLFNTSITIKALKDGKKGVASTNRVDKEAIDEAVESCMTSAKDATPDDAEMIAPFVAEKEFEGGAKEADKDRLFDRLQEFIDTLKTDYPKIILEQMISSFTRNERTYMNTNGTILTSRYGGYGFEAMFSAHEGEQSSSFNGYGVRTDNLSTPFADLGMLRTLLKESELQLNPKPVEGKFVGTLLITPACLMEILSSVFGSCITDTGLIDGTSPWKDKLGQQVVGRELTISSVPFNPNIAFGERFTADGYLSEDFDIIKDGVLNSFLLSQYGAKKTGNERAKNMSYSIAVAPGGKSLDELISGIDSGILLNRFSGGAPGINGDFSGVAKNSFRIESGKVTNAVSETMISGNLLEMLNNVVGISKERICDGGTILPWAAFGGITISGK